MLKHLSILAAALTLTACGANIEEASKEFEEAKKNTAQLGQDYVAQVEKRRVRRVEIANRLYLAPQVTKSLHGEPLPEEWLEQEYSLKLLRPALLEEVAAELRSLYGLIVTVDDRSRASRRRTAEDDEDSDQIIETRLVDDYERLDLSETTKRVDVSGNLETILNQIAAIYGVDWQHEGGVLTFSAYVTETFEIKTMDGVKTYASQVSATGTSAGAAGGGGAAGGAGGSGGNAGSISTSIEADSDAYAYIRDALVNSILPDDATVEVLPGHGGILVTAPAWIMGDVRKFINNQNEVLTRVVAVEVAVYSVTKDQQDNAAASMDLVLRDLNNRFGVSFRSTSFTEQTAGASLSGSIIAPATGSGLAFDEGTSLVAESFRSIGRVNTAFKEKRYIRAGRPALFTSGNDRGFIRQRQVTPIGTQQNQALTQTEQTEGITTGFSLGLRGRALNDGTILVNMRLSIRDLREIENLGTNGLQFPNVDRTELDEELHLSPGEAIIFQGFTRATNRISETDGGHLLCTFWCYDDFAENEKQEFYVVVRADLLEKPRVLRSGR